MLQSATPITSSQLPWLPVVAVVILSFNTLTFLLISVRLKVEIHEIQFSEVTNYRIPRNPPPISRNPHPKKRNPTPATKSTATPPKANYRNPPALDGVCLRMALLRCYVQSSTPHSERWHTSKSIRLALIIAYYPSHRRLIQPGRWLKWTLCFSSWL